MSIRTEPSLAKIDALLAALKALPASSEVERIVEDAEALRRAVAAFHMEAIRFRMYSVDRALKHAPEADNARHVYDDLRHVLEEAGFHTRSHSAP
jgi:hypothetical protein